MVPDIVIFRDLAYVFLAAVIGGAVAWLARQPLILGYVAGGILIGPFTPGPVLSDVHTFEVVAEIGVVLLMFSIGIEFSLSDLLRVKWVALLGGPLGIVLSAGLGVGVGRAPRLAAAAGARHRPRRVGGEHDGAGAAPHRPRRAALAPRPRDDRHHAGRGPGRGGADRGPARAGGARARPAPRRGGRAGQGPRHPRPVRLPRVEGGAAAPAAGRAHGQRRAAPHGRARHRARAPPRSPTRSASRWRSARSWPGSSSATPTTPTRPWPGFCPCATSSSPSSSSPSAA